jgi:acyl-[acyl carrier protein]--UDP-N-acetylglucosamine O-acyltransferase
VNPGANIAGGVVLGEGVTIGSGAQVLQYLHVGSGAIVGVGGWLHATSPKVSRWSVYQRGLARLSKRRHDIEEALPDMRIRYGSYES